jgi:hypothetical protein
MHAVPRVTSVNPGAFKYNCRAESRGGGGGGGASPFCPEPLSVEPVRNLPEYPGSSLKVVNPVFVLRNYMYALCSQS